MNQPLRVLIVDGQATARQSLQAVLALCPELEVVGEAANDEQAMELVADLRPSVVLIDAQIPPVNGLDAIRQINSRWPAIKVIVLTSFATKRAEALAAGADHFLLKGEAFETLWNAIVG